MHAKVTEQSAQAGGTEVEAHAGEHCMAVRQALQADGELDIRGAHYVLDLEVLEARIIAQLCDDLAILRTNISSQHLPAAGFCLSWPSSQLHLAPPVPQHTQGALHTVAAALSLYDCTPYELRFLHLPRSWLLSPPDRRYQNIS